MGSTLYPKKSVISLLFVLSFCHPIDAISTFELNYDGGIGSNLLTGGSKGTITDKLGRHLATMIGSDVFLSWKKINSKSVPMRENFAQMSPTCRFKSHFGQYGKSIICDFEVVNVFMAMELSLALYPKSDQDGKVAAKVNILLTDVDDQAQPVLIDVVSNINQLFHIVRAPWTTPVWDIQPRPSLLLNQEPSDMLRYQNFNDPATMESILLSNTKMAEKECLSKHKNMEIWRYYEYGTAEPITALFLDNTLRYTTKFSGKAHAEAFIHPAMISVEEPEDDSSENLVDIAIFSEAPLALVKEVLKYKVVDTVYLYNVDSEQLDLMIQAFPDLNDCSHYGDRPVKCMDSVDIETDLENSDADYDLIFIDATPDAEDQAEFLSQNEMEAFAELIWSNNDGVVVMNIGMTPDGDLDLMNNDIGEDARLKFLRMAPKEYKDGGLSFDEIHVYDEVRFQPYHTSFPYLYHSLSLL